MAEEYSIEVLGQKYFESEEERTYTIYFSVPDSSNKPGLCLLIAGFGGDACSNVYKKMRRVFAEKENLVVIQCDYFGCEFMGKKLDEQIMEKRFSVGDFLSVEEWEQLQNGTLNFKNIDIKIYNFSTTESRDCFCEMGLFQAMDNLRAVKVVMDILEQNQMLYDEDRIIAYGHSHGAYLAYVCNALAPNLFSGIIDNSAWLEPVYLTYPRIRYQWYLYPNISNG